MTPKHRTAREVIADVIHECDKGCNDRQTDADTVITELRRYGFIIRKAHDRARKGK